MKRILIRDTAAITLDPRAPVLKKTCICISDGRILAMGEPPEGFVADETVDGSELVAMPGLFNSHAHAAMTLIRGWAEDLPLDRWLNERIWVSESSLREEDVYWGAALAACEMIRSGTVAMADHYFWMDQVARVVEESGMKALLAWCVFGLGPGQEIGDTCLERTADFVRRWHGAAGGRIRTALGPHSPYICSPEFLKRVAREAGRLDVGVHLHVAESREQVDRSYALHGRSPVAHLVDLGILDLPAIAAHCICVDEEDMGILADREVHVVHCPKTYMKLSMGVTPVCELLARGVNVALGTDGAASNNSLDLLEAARLTALLQKLLRGDPEAIPVLDALGLATTSGARAMGFDSGILAPGKAADLILIDLARPHMRPRHDLAANVLYAGRPGDVSHVMVDGRWLLHDGRLVTLDEDKILAEAERRGLRMVGQEMWSVREYEG